MAPHFPTIHFYQNLPPIKLQEEDLENRVVMALGSAHDPLTIDQWMSSVRSFYRDYQTLNRAWLDRMIETHQGPEIRSTRAQLINNYRAYRQGKPLSPHPDPIEKLAELFSKLEELETPSPALIDYLKNDPEAASLFFRKGQGQQIVIYLFAVSLIAHEELGRQILGENYNQNFLEGILFISRLPGGFEFSAENFEKVLDSIEKGEKIDHRDIVKMVLKIEKPYPQELNRIALDLNDPRLQALPPFQFQHLPRTSLPGRQGELRMASIIPGFSPPQVRPSSPTTYETPEAKTPTLPSSPASRPRGLASIVRTFSDHYQKELRASQSLTAKNETEETSPSEASQNLPSIYSHLWILSFTPGAPQAAATILRSGISTMGLTRLGAWAFRGLRLGSLVTPVGIGAFVGVELGLLWFGD